MDQAITFGHLMWFVIIVGGLFGLGALCFWILSIIAEGFKH